MAGKLDLLLEAEKRGILPDEQRGLLDEARKRGLVPGSERSYPERVLKEGLPAVGNMVTDIARTGVAGLGAVIGGMDGKPLLDTFNKNQEALHDVGRMKSPEIQATENSAMELMDNIMQGLNQGAVQAVHAIPFAGPKLVEQFEPGIRAAADIGTNLLPIPGVDLLGKGVSKIGRMKGERLAREAKLAEEAERIMAESRKNLPDDAGNSLFRNNAEQGDLFPLEAQQAKRDLYAPGVVEDYTGTGTPEGALDYQRNQAAQAGQYVEPDLFAGKEKLPQDAGQPTPPIQQPIDGATPWKQAPLDPMRFANESGTPDALTSGSVPPSGLPFTGRAELPFNLVEDLAKAHDGLGTVNVAKAITELRAQWDRVEKMMQQASDARLERTNKGTVEKGPYKTTLKMLEEKKAAIQKEAEILAEKHGEYISKLDEATQQSMARILETNPRGIHNKLDLGPREEKTSWPWIEKTQTLADRNKFNNEGDRALSIHTAPVSSRFGGKQRGMINFDAFRVDPRKDFAEYHQKIKNALSKSFAILKEKYPRFSEINDIYVMGRKEWHDFFMGEVKKGQLHPDDVQPYFNGEIVASHDIHAKKIYVNALAPELYVYRNDPAKMASILAHELTHAYQEKKGRLKKWDSDTANWDKPYRERPWEVEAFRAEETALKALRKKQGGGWTPFASSKAEKSNAAYQAFKQELGDVPGLSEAHIKALFNKQQSQTKQIYTPPSPEASVGKVTSQIPGLQKLTDQYLNTWTHEQMVQAVKDWGKDIQFGTKNTVKKIVNGRFVAKTHPLLSYISSNIHKVKNEVRLKSENALMGDAYDAKGNRIPAKGSPMEIWSRLDEKAKEVLNDVGQHFTNKSDAVVTDAELNAAARKLHGRDLTAEEIQSYRDRRKGADRVWQDLNDYINAHPKANGALREPLPYLHNFWSPAEFSGKFLVFVKDPVTKKVEAMQGSYFMPDQKSLQAKFPGKEVSFIEKDVYNNLNPDALEATIRYLAEPKREAVRAALNEAMKSQGFSKHGKKREGVAGWMGSEGGKKGVTNYEKVYEDYIRSVYNHIGNRELDSLYTKISDETALRDSVPRAQHLALESIDQGRGRMNAGVKALEAEVGKALNSARLPQSFLGDAGKVVNEASVKMMIAFGKLSQIVAQVFQAPQGTPIKGLMIAAENAGMGPIDSALVNLKVGAKTMHDLIRPSKQTIADIIGLRREGALEAQFQYDYKEYNQGVGAMKNKPKDWLTATAPLTYIESNIVRKPAGLYFTNLLREIGYPESNIYKLATELTDQYMATSKQFESAHVFGRSGLAGRMAKPLEAFSTTWLGTYMEALQSAMSHPTSAAYALPLLYGLGATYAVTGLLGMPGVKEWDAVAEFVNKHANTSFPTGTETIMKHAKSPEARHGWLWAKLGLNLGTTMAAPTATQSVAPGLQLVGNAGSALATGVRNTGVFGEHNKPTSAEKREAIKGITPSSTWGFTESYFSHPDSKSMIDRFVENPNGAYTDSKSSGSVNRTDADWNARKWLGAFTTKEAAEKARNWEVERKGKEMAAHRADLVQIMVDSMISTGRLDPSLMKKAEELQYTGKELNEALKRELKDHILPKEGKLVGKGHSLKQQRAAQLLRELQ